MVQLKAKAGDKWTIDIAISIPYGSIKRSWTVTEKRQQRISIPYGSIKRTISISDKGTLLEFQFLMVQLKVFQFNRYIRIFRTFQFLMVQLKVL